MKTRFVFSANNGIYCVKDVETYFGICPFNLNIFWKDSEPRVILCGKEDYYFVPVTENITKDEYQTLRQSYLSKTPSKEIVLDKYRFSTENFIRYFGTELYKEALSPFMDEIHKKHRKRCMEYSDRSNVTSDLKISSEDTELYFTFRIVKTNEGVVLSVGASNYFTLSDIDNIFSIKINFDFDQILFFEDNIVSNRNGNIYHINFSDLSLKRDIDELQSNDYTVLQGKIIKKLVKKKGSGGLMVLTDEGLYLCQTIYVEKRREFYIRDIFENYSNPKHLKNSSELEVVKNDEAGYTIIKITNSVVKDLLFIYPCVFGLLEDSTLVILNIGYLDVKYICKDLGLTSPPGRHYKVLETDVESISVLKVGTPLNPRKALCFTKTDGSFHYAYIEKCGSDLKLMSVPELQGVTRYP